jgi:predicted PurR-regulated permease PerM
MARSFGILESMSRETGGDIQDSSGTRRFSSIAFLVTLAIVTAISALVAAPVAIPLILSVLTAGLVDPLHTWLTRTLRGSRAVASWLTLIILVTAILLPLLVVGYFAGARLANVIEQVTRNSESLRQVVLGVVNSVREGPLGFLVGPAGPESTQRLFDSIVQSLGNLAEGLTGVAAAVPRLLLMLFIYLYSLYFFLRDGRRMLVALASTVPLRRAEKREFGRTFLTVSRATVKGTVVIGAFQGLIGGALFWVLGLPAPLLFAVLFALLAAIPNFGAVLIWLPTAVVLFAGGDPLRGVLMVGLGGGLIGAVDYLIRPLIIQGDAQLHPVLAIVGIVGGIALFGLEGLLLGPIIMSLFVATWRTFRSRYRHELHTMSRT